jgi:ABC-type sulfate transport system permease subunit
VFIIGDIASESFMFKKIMTSLIERPFLTSIYVADLAILLLHKPPFIFSLVMLGALIAMSMYYGQKLALFK